VNVRRLAFLGAAFAWAAVALPARAEAEKTCALAVPAEMVDKVQSRNARAGGDFRFKTTEPMTLEDGTVVPAGTLGYGLIRFATSAGRASRDGMLSLEPRYLTVTKGKGSPKRVDVTMTPTLPVTWSPNDLLKAASNVPIPVAGLVMTGVNAVRWGRDITLGPGFTFSVIPIGNLAKAPIC
jgi:hypothetical protein